MQRFTTLTNAVYKSFKIFRACLAWAKYVGHHGGE